MQFCSLGQKHPGPAQTNDPNWWDWRLLGVLRQWSWGFPLSFSRWWVSALIELDWTIFSQENDWMDVDLSIEFFMTWYYHEWISPFFYQPPFTYYFLFFGKSLEVIPKQDHSSIRSFENQSLDASTQAEWKIASAILCASPKRLWLGPRGNRHSQGGDGLIDLYKSRCDLKTRHCCRWEYSLEIEQTLNNW